MLSFQMSLCRNLGMADELAHGEVGVMKSFKTLTFQISFVLKSARR